MKALSIFILAIGALSLSAQTPQWNWAKGVGSNGQDGVSGINVDSAGNVYEIITLGGQSVRLGTQTFTNPNPQRSTGGGNSIFIFVKYDTRGNVVWAKQFPYQNGYPLYPSAMCTDRHGNSYLDFYFRDSITLGGITARNTSTSSSFCIATYDPNGNVTAIHVKGTHSFYSPNTSINAMLPWDDGHLLILGEQDNAPDTLDGVPLPNGSFLAIMDTAATLERVKYIGHDTTRFGSTTLIQSIYNLYSSTFGANSTHMCTNDNKTVYLNFASNYKTVFDTSLPITIPGLSISNTPDILIKFDSAFNYEWYITENSQIVYPSMVACDNYDNVYLGGQGSYFYLYKIDSSGNLLWRDGFFNQTSFNGNVQSIFTDKLGNAYMGGRYDSYLIAGTDSLMDDEDLFVVKTYPDGRVAWAQGTLNAQGQMSPYNNFAGDEQGNVYINGLYAYTSSVFGHGIPIFGKDTLFAVTPINGFPQAADIFTTRLGNCNPSPTTLTTSSPLSWCGIDSVTLNATTANTYLWNTGDTTQTVTVHQSGVYAAYAIDTVGCYARSKPDTIKTYPQPVLNLQVNNVLCKGDSTGQLHLTVQNNTGSVQYSFEPLVPDTLKLSAGTYIITATDSVGCVAVDTVTINEPANALSAQAIYYPASQGNESFAVASATGGTPNYSFNWQHGSVVSDTLNDPAPGLYLVTVLDTNGCSATDSLLVPVTTATPQITSTLTISIYPNPTTNSFYIETLVDGELRIYNELGALTHQQKISAGKNKIETSSFSKAIYLIEVITNSGKYNSKLFIE